MSDSPVKGLKINAKLTRCTVCITVLYVSYNWIFGYE